MGGGRRKKQREGHEREDDCRGEGEGRKEEEGEGEGRKISHTYCRAGCVGGLTYNRKNSVCEIIIATLRMLTSQPHG